MPAAASFLVLPEQCPFCFSLQEVSSGGWVSTASSSSDPIGQSWRLATPRSDADILWAIYAGTWGLPGRHPHMHIYTGSGGDTRNLHREEEGDLQWYGDFCDTNTSAPCTEWQFHTAVRSAPAGPSVVPRVTLFGTCADPRTMRNCTYLGAGAHGRLVLGPAAVAADFEWHCVPCPGWPFSAGTAVVLGLVGVAAVLPAVAMWRWSRRPASAEAWPAAPRSRLALGLLLLSWWSVLAGATPGILWYSGRWWNGTGVDYATLALVGVFGLEMFIRADDPLPVLQLVAVAHMLICIVLEWSADTREAHTVHAPSLLHAPSAPRGPCTVCRTGPLPAS